MLILSPWYPRQKFVHYIWFWRLKKPQVPSSSDFRRNIWAHGAFLPSKCPKGEFTDDIRAEWLNNPKWNISFIDQSIFGKDTNSVDIDKLEAVFISFEIKSQVFLFYYFADQ